MPIFWVTGISESHTVKNNLQRIFVREQYSHAKIFAVAHKNSYSRSVQIWTYPTISGVYPVLDMPILTLRMAFKTQV